MIVYSATKNEFINDVISNKIEKIVENEVKRKLNKNSPRNEILSWKNSLDFMFRVLIDNEIPSSAGVAIEYNIPLTNRRVDFILTGKDSEQKDTAVIIELKQWSEVVVTHKDAIVKTRLGGGMQETNHPSYQAWSYAALIEDYNETVRKEAIALKPCAYLHNMESRDAINDIFYKEHTTKAPVFISEDALKLSGFLKKFVKYGDSNNIMYRIEHGVIKPSKNLADSLASMLQGNQEFLLLDEQKLVYETALDLAHKSQEGKKKTLIVKGGPGTGKSVVAINLLVELHRREMLSQYTSKNSAPRDVFKAKLTGSLKKGHIDNLFKGSGSYISTENNFFDVLLVDEAHRLNEKSGMFRNLGENQIKELIYSSKTSVFFIDDAQRVSLQDIGSVEAIKQWAAVLNSEVTVLELASQFRCNGSDGYLAWVDNAVQLRETANTTLDDIDYDLRVFDSPTELRDAIISKNEINNKARMVAGYCWDWLSKKDQLKFDIVIDEFNFQAKWNLTEDGMLWLINPKSVNEVGCIHTCQGLEVDYIGVIVGDDFVIRDGVAVLNADKRSRQDSTIKGYKKRLKDDPAKAHDAISAIIKNTYRTLMTRGQKGCFIYCVDKETNEYFKSISARNTYELDKPLPYDGLLYPVVSFENAKPYQGCVPVFDIAAAAGEFSSTQYTEGCEWVELPDDFVTREGMFIIQVVGESMNRRIPNGSWCLFKANPAGTRNNKVVLVQHRDIHDSDHGGTYTVKIYHSEKIVEDDAVVNQKIILSPDTNAFGYKPIVFENKNQNLVVLGEFVAVI
jgi:DUF2075 family protein